MPTACHYRWIDRLDNIELLSDLTWQTCYVSEIFCHFSHCSKGKIYLQPWVTLNMESRQKFIIWQNCFCRVYFASFFFLSFFFQWQSCNRIFESWLLCFRNVEQLMVACKSSMTRPFTNVKHILYYFTFRSFIFVLLWTEATSDLYYGVAENNLAESRQWRRSWTGDRTAKDADA